MTDLQADGTQVLPARAEHLQPRLMPPPCPVGAVSRDALIARIEEGSQGRLTLLTAPAGFGKSVLLVQWAAACPTRPITWMLIDPSHSDALTFGRLLVEALRRLDPTIGASALERIDATGTRLGAPFLREILDDLRELPESVLVIEDIHEASNPEVLEELVELIETSSPQVHFVISSRSDVLPGTHRLRSRGELCELRGDELAFDEHATRALVQRIGRVELDEHQLTTLHTRTEGWAAGILLAALAMQSARSIDTLIEEFAGEDRSIAEYLTQEILTRQPEHIRGFLSMTSILERLTASLCDAVTGARDGQQMLERVESDGLFLNRLDNRRRWFRYHPLFRDLLRLTLVTDDPDIERLLLRRAANWHLAQGYLAVGVEYLLQARAWDEVTDIVMLHGRELWERGETTAAARWLEMIPERSRSTRPTHRLATAWMLGWNGRHVAAAQIVDEVQAAAATKPGERLLADMLRATLVQSSMAPERVIESADRLLAGLATPVAQGMPDIFGLGLPGRVELVALVSKGRALLHTGDLEGAREQLSAAVAHPDMSYPPYAVHTHGSLALLDAITGSLADARARATRALSIAHDTDLVGHAAVADALLALGRVHCERAEYDRATDALAEGLERSMQNDRGMLVAIQRVESALLHLAKCETDLGLQTLTVEAGGVPVPRGIADRQTAVEIELLVAANKLDRARRLVDAADLDAAFELRAAAVSLAFADEDDQAARSLLTAWPDDGVLGSRLARLVWDAAATDREGHPDRAREIIAEAIALGEAEGHVRVFQSAGSHVSGLLRSYERRQPSEYVHRLLTVARTSPPKRNVPGLPAALTARELLVLGFLPDRTSIAEIAEQLYISKNTLKTHIKHIYWKLGVGTRDEAVAAAQKLHLL